MTTGNTAVADQVQHDADLLDALRTALLSLNVSATVIRVIRLNMRAGNPACLHHMPPVLEVRGRERELRARVDIVGNAGGRAYRIRPSGRAEEQRFPIGAHEEAAIHLHSLVRGWRAL